MLFSYDLSLTTISQIKYKHLNCEERTLIQLSLERGCTFRAIARSSDRYPCSTSRKLTKCWCD